MTIQLSGIMLDIFIGIILFLSFIHGYQKGIVDRVLHFISSLFILVISWFLSKPLALFFNFDILQNLDPALVNLLAPIVGRVIGFVLLFFILSIARSILFKFISSVIEGIKKHLALVRWVDNALGAVFNVAKNTLYVYVALIILCLPVFSNGVAVVQDSTLGTAVMHVSPALSNSIIEIGEQAISMSHVEEWVNGDFDMVDFVKMLDAMNRLDVLNEENLNHFFDEYQQQMQSIPGAVVSSEEYQELMNMIDDLPAAEHYKEALKKRFAIN